MQQFIELEPTQLERFIFDQVRFPPDNTELVLDQKRLIREFYRTEELRLENNRRHIHRSESDSDPEMEKVDPITYRRVLEANGIEELGQTECLARAPTFVKDILKTLDLVDSGNQTRRRHSHPKWYIEEDDQTAKKFLYYESMLRSIRNGSKKTIENIVYSALALDSNECEACDAAMCLAADQKFGRVFLNHFQHPDLLVVPQPDLYFGYETDEFLDNDQYIPKN
ncbi:uncharacterized protein F4822DRAFT_269004 [Hypoxylon trugodes]|uniref:uncharacterized protein n=1 Tax=Hypoxylon trugodes TaxID=326681 RepID=UPI00218D5D29|nr:uncharacterized protein F4822DRAFT_269004 [Hypoxylon trugodes]KAI1389091.1 hypothetical protein F4822DRAFT_269004 [Hypoxylon trugodes]